MFNTINEAMPYEFPVDFISKGDFIAMRYGNKLELENGTIYITDDYIKMPRDPKNFKLYHIERKNISETDDVTPIGELPDGEYKGLIYGNYFELENGRLYKCNVSYENTREQANMLTYNVNNGILTEIESMSNCPDGEYVAKRYLNIFKLENGKMYATDICVKCTEHLTSYRHYTVEDGHEFEKEN